MIEHKLVRVEHRGDPEQCQGVGATGQCPYKRSEGSQYCSRHGSNSQVQAKEAQSLHAFKLNTWQTRVNEFAGDGNVKTLRGEIGILRLLIEKIVNSCTNDVELICNSAKISDLLVKAEKLVVSCNNIETKMGMLLDRTVIVQIGALIVEVIAEFVNEPEARELASNKILDIMINTTVKKDL